MPKSSREAATPKAILPSLPEYLSGQLFAGATSRHLDAGERLFVAGDSGDGCYLLERGLLKVIIASPQGEERILSFIGPGAIAGELAIIDRHPRSASVIAVKDCELSFISREHFEEYEQHNPEIYLSFPKIISGHNGGVDRTRSGSR
jgi:CRP/FNR family transcriptional regulator, cyclic AMP receptor protein